MKLLSTGAIFLILSGCGQEKEYVALAVDNPPFKGNTVFSSFEDLSDPKFKALKEKHQLDTIFHGEKDEMKRIFLLRHWIHEKIKIDDYGPYAGNGSVESILDEALKGQGFHCGHYMAVQNALLNAYGYVTRCLLVDTGVPVEYMVGGGHHAVNEVWLNGQNKWFLADAKYDYHFEKNSIPLSALEIRDAYLKDKAATISLVKGPERNEIQGLPEYNIDTKEKLVKIFTWISWDKYNNRYTGGSDISSDIIMYADDYFSSHSISGNIATITLSSTTPNLATYQMKILPDTAWRNITNPARLKLTKDETEIFCRTINLGDVPGVEHKIIIKAL